MTKRVEIETTEGPTGTVTVEINTGSDTFAEWLARIEKLAAETRAQDLEILRKAGR